MSALATSLIVIAGLALVASIGFANEHVRVPNGDGTGSHWKHAARLSLVCFAIAVLGLGYHAYEVCHLFDRLDQLEGILAAIRTDRALQELERIRFYEPPGH